MIDILKKINIPSSDNGKKFLCTNRRDKIIEILTKSKWKKVVDDDFLLIYNNKFDESYKDIILISCHIDSVFNKRDYFPIITNSGKIKGLLDNSASIVVLLKAMLENKLPPNVFVTFTGNEEKKLRGASKTIDCFQKKLKYRWKRLSLVIVLDVSNKNWGNDVSIENLFIEENPLDASTLKFQNVDSFIEYITKILKKKNISFGVLKEDKAEEDESNKYKKFDLNVFSLCLPVHIDCRENDDCKKDICYDKKTRKYTREHCIKGIITTKQKMKRTKKALIEICNFTINH